MSSDEVQGGAPRRQSHLQRQPAACLHWSRCRLGRGCRPGVSGFKDQTHRAAVGVKDAVFRKEMYDPGMLAAGAPGELRMLGRTQ